MRGRYLVTGGAGFVGSHVVAALLDRGANVVVVDDLSSGHRGAVLPGATLVEADIADERAVDALLADGPWDALFHLATGTPARDDTSEPFRHLQDDAARSIRLIEACARRGVWRVVLSSTISVYDTATIPLVETSPIAPGSPGGEGARMVERALYWADRLCGVRHAVLRYAIAAGADPAGRLGEDHRPETHLIPRVIDAALGRSPTLEIHGGDYPTPDGTCIRDYVHVSDLARMHLAVLDQLKFGSVVFNLGNGPGHSVLQVVRSVERVTGLRVSYVVGRRRPGAPARMIISSARARREVGWHPCLPLDEMVRTAFAWRLAHPRGYAA